MWAQHAAPLHLNSYQHSALAQIILALADGVLAKVKDAGGQRRAGAGRGRAIGLFLENDREAGHGVGGAIKVDAVLALEEALKVEAVVE